MPTSNRQQHSFSGGEVALTLADRGKIDNFTSMLEICRNAYPNNHGNWVNRGGQEYVGTYFDETKRSRLIRFEFSNTQTYVLELFNNGFRVIKEGVMLKEVAIGIASIVASTLTLDTPSPILKSDVKKLVFNGTGHVDYPDGLELWATSQVEVPTGAFKDINIGTYDYPNQVKFQTLVLHGRSGTGVISGIGFDTNDPFDNSWMEQRPFFYTVFSADELIIDVGDGPGQITEFEARTYVVPDASPPTGSIVFWDQDEYVLFADAGLTTLWPGPDISTGTISVYVSGDAPWVTDDLRDITYQQSNDTITFQHRNWESHQIKRGVTELDWAVTPHRTAPSEITAVLNLDVFDHVGDGGDRSYTVTAVSRRTGEESIPHEGITAEVYGERLIWDLPYVYGDEEPLLYYVYAGIADQKGLIGASNGTSFNLGGDPGITPEDTISPPKTVNPFDEAGKFPGAGTYFQERIWFAGTIDDPQRIWGSKTGAYRAFGQSIPIGAADGIDATIVARASNPILHLLGKNILMLGTSNGIWTVQGDESGTLTAVGDFHPRIQTQHGMSHTRPLEIGDVVLYVQTGGRSVRDLSYVFEKDAFSAIDVTKLAKHMFRGDAIVEWDYSEDPDSLVWSVTESGKLKSLTYLREDRILAWARHDTYRGTYETVASVKEGSIDPVYLGVKRTVNGVTRRFIERIGDRDVDDVRDAFFLDAGLSMVDTPLAVTITKTDSVKLTFASAHGHSNDDFLDIVHLVDRKWPFAKDEQIENDPVNDYPGDLHHRRYQVLDNDPDTDGLSITIKDVETGDSIDGTVDSFMDRDELDGQPIVRWPVTSADGALHLAGEPVTILADGNVQPPQIVSATGGITFPLSSRVHMGLSYQSDLRTLKPVLSQAGDVAVGPAAAAEAIISVVRSRGGWMGDRASKLSEIAQRTTEPFDSTIELYTGTLKHNPEGGWKRGQIMFRQYSPLPVSITSISYKLRSNQ